MFGLTDCVGRATFRAASIAAVCLLALSAGMSGAKAETRTLKFYNLHTKEKASIAYKKNGRYSPEGLKQINWFLRDWRRKEPTKMDTRLLDLIWEAYRQSGSRDYINVICGYRAPATNNMLRSRSSGVAKQSQHTQGRALDFYLPDVPLKKLREIGLRMEVGGVGYYPRSGSPFVHFDVGNARHWPRMSRKELAAVFPKGNTIHVPSDGKPLPGYEQALASYKSRKGASAVQVAGSSAKSGGGKTLLAALFGGGADEEDDIADVETAATDKRKAPAAAAPKAPERAAPKPEADVAVAAMVPTQKPNLLAAGVPLPIRDTFDTGAPTPPAALKAAEPEVEAETEVAALELGRIPLPRSAPNRPTASPVAEEAAPASDDVSALVAALESSPTEDERMAGAAGQLAYSVPTPRDRPPFESILKDVGEEPMIAAAAPSEDEIKKIVEASTAMRADVVSRQKAAIDEPATSKAPPQKLLLAALEAPSQAPAAPPAARALPTRIPVPTGKTGRFKKAGVETAAAAPAQAKRSQATITSRIEMASLVADPEKRAATSVMTKPKADVLVRDVPTSVFTAGFAANPLSGKSDRFVGSAVNFLPVAKFE